MSLLASLPQDSRAHLVALLGGPGAVHLLTTSSADRELLRALQAQRQRLLLALQPLWLRPLAWPLAGATAQARLRCATRVTGDYAAEALRRWHLAEAEEVDETFLVQALRYLNFSHVLRCAEDHNAEVREAIDVLTQGDWHVRYFKSINALTSSGLLIRFRVGLFEGSLFVQEPESESEETESFSSSDLTEPL